MFAYLDFPIFLQKGFQDPATPIMEGIIDLHNHIFFFLVGVTVFVLWALYRILYLFFYEFNFPQTKDSLERRKYFPALQKVTHGTVLEIVWTIIPSVILMFIAVPSFALLYTMDEVIDPSVTFKVIGHQWYWSYECNDELTLGPDKNVQFDSYMLSDEDLTKGQLRLLEVDNALVLPVRTHIRLIITSSDVIHSWAVPSLGIKLDAVPGRLNQTSLFLKRQGVFYGQCSEICGVNHGFMPIVVKSYPLKKYISWLYSF